MINIGVVGYGYWGPNLVRNFMSTGISEVVVVCDLNLQRLARFASEFPRVRITNSLTDLLNDISVDAVVVSTPLNTHFEIAMAALNAGKHVLIEKPIASSAVHAEQLIEEADKRGLVLMVDHTFLYTPAVRKIRELVRHPDFGNINYFDSTRVNLGLFQQDVSVLWDLAVHDLSIMSFLIDKNPRAVSATGKSRSSDPFEYASFLTVFYDDIIAHVNVNWLSPVKIRRTLVGGSGKMLVYDDLDPSEKIKLYDKGVTIVENEDEKQKYLISYRTGDMIAPKLDQTEALKIMVLHFLECIERASTPISSGEDGLVLVRILEAADVSIRQRGTPQELL